MARLALVAVLCLAPVTAAGQPPPSLGGPASIATAVPRQDGRVIVTIAVEGIRIPGVTVALRSVDGNIVVAQTTSDTIGQVTFPDVPAGRYVIRAVRDGFANTDSSPFTVSNGETEQVLVEMRLTFVRESVDVVVPANSPTESLQPVAVSDLLTGEKRTSSRWPATTSSPC